MNEDATDLPSGLAALLKRAASRRMTASEIAAQRRDWALAEMAFGSDQDEAAYADAVQRNDVAEVLRLERESDARRATAEQFSDEILTGSGSVCRV